MDMIPGSKHNDEHDEAQKKVFRGYGFRPGGKNMFRLLSLKSLDMSLIRENQEKMLQFRLSWLA